MRFVSYPSVFSICEFIFPQHRAKFRPNLYHRLTPDATKTVPDVTAISDSANPSPISETFSEAHVESESEKMRAERARKSQETQEDRPSSAPPELSNPVAEAKRQAGSHVSPVLRALDSVKKLIPKPKRVRRRTRRLRQDNISPEVDPADDDVAPTDVLEVWFAGCHCGTFPTIFLSHTRD